MKKCCSVLYFDYTDIELGWDAYLKKDCVEFDGSWVPDNFDNAIVNGAATKSEAQKEAKKYLEETHILGLCLNQSQ